MLKPIEQCSGELRLEIREVFDYGEYLKRNKIEAIFSALKRKYSSSLRSRSVKSQRKELYLKVILFNMEKKITAIFLIFFSRITFQQSPNLYKLNLFQIYSSRASLFRWTSTFLPILL